MRRGFEPFRVMAQTHLSGDYEASKLLETLRTGILQPEMPVDVDYVRIMSLHKSKGLTANLVVVTGCIDGAIPTIDQTLQGQERPGRD